jgi:hypothetical protein
MYRYIPDAGNGGEDEGKKRGLEETEKGQKALGTDDVKLIFFVGR